MRLRTAPALPVPAHVMSGVSPVAIAVFGFAPAFSRRSTMAALAFVHASDNGVVRRSLAASTCAPARMRRSAVSRSFQCAAQSSAVDPSSARTLGSAPCFNSLRTLAGSLLRAASTRRRSPSAAETTAAIRSARAPVANTPARPPRPLKRPRRARLTVIVR